MIVAYHDHLGYVEVDVSEDGIDFVDRFPCFESGDIQYKILAENIVSIRE